MFDFFFFRIVKCVGDFLEPAEYDSFASVAVNILHKCDRALPLIALLINEELKSATAAGKFSLFRGNNFVSAAEKAFVSLLFFHSSFINHFSSLFACLFQQNLLERSILSAFLAPS